MSDLLLFEVFLGWVCWAAMGGRFVFGFGVVFLWCARVRWQLLSAT